MKFLMVLGASVVLTTAAGAVEDQDLAKCATLQGDLTRLSCFDDLVRSAGLDRPQTLPVANSSPGKWRVSRDVNPIDDSERVVLQLTADSGTSQWDRPISFIARCQSSSTEAYINWDDYLGNDGSIRGEYKNVTVRIGSDSATTERWGLSTDSEATFAPSWAGDLLKRMAQSDKFIAQVTPYNESPVTAIFDTSGMAEALVPLMEACDWSL